MVALVSTWQMADAPPSTAQQVAALRAFAAAAAVPLSSIRQPRHLLGQRAAALLFDEVEALDTETPHEHRHEEFVPELVVRASTAVPRPRTP